MIDHLKQAIYAYTDAVRDDPGNATCLGDLGIALFRHFEQLGDVNDINKAVSVEEAAVHLTLDDSSEKPARLNNLGNYLRARFKQLGDLSDLNESIMKLEDAVCLTPNGHPDKPTYLHNLGISLQIRFKQLGDLSDLNEGTVKLEDADAVRLTPNGHPDKPCRLHNLSNPLRARFHQLGNLSDLNESIVKLKDAFGLTPDGHPEKLSMLESLGNSLLDRFKHLGDLSDLNEGIMKLEDAVCLTPDGHPDKPAHLQNLGNSLLARFKRFDDLSDLNEGMMKLEDAFHLTPDGHPDKPSSLNNLVNSLYTRFQRLGDLSDLTESISMCRAAVCLTPDGHPNKPGWLYNLSKTLLTLFNRLGDLSNLNESISKVRDAVFLTPDGHPDKPLMLITLGDILFHRFGQSQNHNDLEEMILQYTAAALSSTGSAGVRIGAASRWSLNAKAIQHPSLLEAYNVSLNLLPEIAWLGLSINDRHYEIRDAGLVVMDAASVAISSGQPEKAVEWLEQGRSIIWGQLLNLRTPGDALKEKFPELAKEFTILSTQLEESTTRQSDEQLLNSVSLGSISSIAHRAHENAHKRDLLLKRIRELEGFQRFLLPKIISELSPAAQKGPVVFLNVSTSSCDALALLPGLADEVIHVPLPELTPDHVKTLKQSFERLLPYMGRGDFERLHGQREGGSAGLENDFSQILSDLWVRLVKPVLNALAIMTPTKSNLPRIWWCPTGTLTSLPVHAAGLYGKDDAVGSKLSDFAVSSYTPSLAALIQGFRPASHSEQGLLAVAQPSAIGQSHIPGTKDEIKRIQECARGKIPMCSLVEHEATVARVEEGMTKSSLVHFACHGIQDVDTPTESALLLAGSSRLTLKRTIQLSLPHADLAFLSACQTATGDKQLQEESVHLAAGMLLAGYRGVIATMWSIQDNDAPQVAADVYEHLFKTSPPDPTRAAEALHLAMINLRERTDSKGNKTSFFRWVPFIHLGV
ncbi:CHAT domain-containing protein [Mycena leptocephala]|nr:CHAT domain-containing protein [Mycena leptocephala]